MKAQKEGSAITFILTKCLHAMLEVACMWKIRPQHQLAKSYLKLCMSAQDQTLIDETGIVKHLAATEELLLDANDDGSECV